MSRHIFILALLCWVDGLFAADKAVIFNHISGQRTEFDNLAHAHFGKQYRVVDVDDREHTYVRPRSKHGFGRAPPVYIENKCVRGNVLVLYVIAIDGSVASPYVAKSINPLLSEIAVQSVSVRRFYPAQLNGKSVSTLAASQINFRCPA